jgi:hypothetical protein
VCFSPAFVVVSLMTLLSLFSFFRLDPQEGAGLHCRAERRQVGDNLQTIVTGLFMHSQTPSGHSPFWPVSLASLALVFSASCLAQNQPDAAASGTLPAVTTTWRLTDETWKLPAHESMGMVGGTLLFEVSPQVQLGVGSYGAVRGQRGGFITLGLAAEVNQPLIDRWSAEAGLFVGGGGGRGGASLAGGGLMLRSHAGLSYDTQGHGKLGLGLSHVSFPSGVVQSTQPYLKYDYAFSSLLANGWRSAPTRLQSTDTPLLSKPQEFSLVYRHYNIPSTVVQDGGAAQHRTMQLMGVEWLSYLDAHWFLKLEAEGAMGGKSSGYMQIFTGAGYRLPLGASTALKVHAAAGPAGGGSVATGGGWLLDSGIALQQKISRSTALELSLGQVRAPSASFQASSLALKLNHQFGLPGADRAVSWGALRGFEPQSLRIRAVNQTYLQGSPHWRSSNVDTPVDNLGVQLDYFLPGDHNATRFFITGQGLAAYAGKAGAYMNGLVGGGVQVPLTQTWFVEGEGLVGAAGGGGLTVGSGLVGQANASLGYRLSDALSLLGTLGTLSAVRGDFKAKVVGLSLVYQFTGFAEK